MVVCCLLFDVSWFIVTARWLLVIVHWSLVVGCCIVFTVSIVLIRFLKDAFVNKSYVLSAAMSFLLS